MASNFNYTLKYRTFNQLLEDVSVDFKNFALENMIEPQQLIKVAMRVSYDLGLRIQQQKEAVLEICHGKCRLPDDFFSVNYALMCGSWITETALPAGTHVEDRPCPIVTTCPTTPYQQIGPAVIDLCAPPPGPCEPAPCSTVKPTCCLSKCGEEFQLVQIIKSERRVYKYFHSLKFRSGDGVDKTCVNYRLESPNEAWIKNGFLYINMEDANVYLNYQGTLEDEDGNLLVPDHPMLNEYYEYALKLRILENLMMGGEDVVTRLQYIQSQYRPARNNALSLVNTPNFQEMKELWQANRKAMYSKYFDMFSSYGRYYPHFNSPRL